MIYVLLGFLTLLGILAFFRLLTVISKRRNRLTALEVADKIERHIEGTEGPYDWDAFTTIPIRDDKLDEVRRRCGDADLRELRRIVEDLRRKRLKSSR